MVETNIIVFQFFSSVDKEKVIQGSPWLFDNQLLKMKEIDGGFIEFDDSNDPLGLDNLIRLKVMMDIGKPLRRGIKVDIKYERLGDFCYYYGKLGHVDRDCDAINGEEDNKKEMVYKYGPWMRASLLKRNRISKEEWDNEKMMLNKLKSENGECGLMVSNLPITKLGPPGLAKKVLFKEVSNEEDEAGKEKT
ncbi:Cobalt-precorrin-5B C(1)-methyltransferase [Bienertia sinuspersici]